MRAAPVVKILSIPLEGSHLRGPADVGADVLVEPEKPTPGDHQVGDLARLRAHHEVLDTAEGFVLRFIGHLSFYNLELRAIWCVLVGL